MSKRKLLLADDSMTIQKVVNLTFADEGIEVFTVGNGTLAIERLSEIEPDLVLADVHMPGLTGYEVCEQIRMNPRFQNVPVMLLVGSFEPFDETEAKRVGANDYLTKPFQSIRQLIQKVTALLADPQSEMNGVNEDEMPALSTDANVAQGNSFAAKLTENSFEETPVASQNNVAISAHETSFGDTALDDEMIETSSAGNLAGNFSEPILSSQFEQSSGEIKTSNAEKTLGTNEDLTSEKTLSEEIDPEMRRTEPLSYNDIQEMNSSMLAPVEPEKNDQWQQTFESDTHISHESILSLDVDQTVSSGDREQNEFGGRHDEESDLELDLPASQEDLSETSDFEIIGGEETLPMETRAEIAEFRVSLSSETVMNDNEPLELDLDEMNLLQIDDEDSILDLQTEEATANFSMADLEVSPQMQKFSESPNSRVSQVATQAVATMNSDFPPHVIEAIAQLVIEKLSDKVIEKIAWEIVPDRFDLIVRKQMEQRDR